MSHNFTLSVTGLALIKSFEGFRPIDRTLVNGQRVVGYGHKVRGDDAMSVTRTEANEILKDDLAPYEDMVNNEVYAPLNQHQFDALVSLAFSLGPKAFQLSPTLHLVNNGRPLDAARSFEVWRKSRMNGRTYIVDALVRRRAAEKALFLRLDSGYVAANRVGLKPIEDTRLVGDIMSGELPVFKSRDLGIVTQVPYTDTEVTDIEPLAPSTQMDGEPSFEQKLDTAIALDAPRRRREDGPAGVLTLSEIIEADDVYADDADMYTLEGISADLPESTEPSPIAVAAAEVSGRLDALIEDAPQTRLATETADWPESLITAEADDKALKTKNLNDIVSETDVFDDTVDLSKPADIIDIKSSDTVDDIVDSANPGVGALHEAYVADMIAEDTPEIIKSKPQFDLAANDYTDPAILENERKGGLGPYLIMMVLGLTLIGGSIGAMLRGGTTQLGETMPFWSGVGLIVGAVILMVAIYYVLKFVLKRGK